MSSAGSDWNQEPNLLYVPEYASSTGAEAVELCKSAGLNLDPWQELVLTHSLGELTNGKWAAFEVGLVVPRQNGKTLLAVARELVGLFLLGEPLIIHSAHQFDTSLEAFRNLTQLIEETPHFDREVKKITRSHGEEGVELKNGQRVRFRTRSGKRGGGRGFTGDCLILDEAMILPEATIASLMPTLSARPNPQVWYLGSAVDQEIHEDGIVLARLRERARSGKKGHSLAYFEFSLAYDHPDDVPMEDAEDPKSHRRTNPAYDIRISPDYVKREQQSMDPRTFAVERLGVGDWPDPNSAGMRPISPQMWAGCTDRSSQADDPICLAFDVSPDRKSAAVGCAGYRGDKLTHVECIKHSKGTHWVAEALQKLTSGQNVAVVVCDSTGPAAGLVPDIEKLGVEVKMTSSAEHAAACGMIFDSVVDRTLRHLGTQDLQAAIAGAIRRPLLDRWAWSRINSHIDISPLVAVTLALWGLRSEEDSTPEVWSMSEVVARLRREERPEVPAPAETPSHIQGWVPI